MLDKPESDTFDWVVSWPLLKPHLLPAALGLNSECAQVLDIGCGFSTLPLVLADMYANVTAIDREEHCVRHMQVKYQDSKVRWRAADCCCAPDVAALLPNGYADLIADKGMLDCALTEGTATKLLCSVDQLLSSGGLYVVVSFRSADLLLPLLSCASLAWNVTHEPLPMSNGDPASICTISRRGDGGPCQEEVVSKHVDQILDWWYTQQRPMLTADREQQIRDAWTASVPNDGCEQDGADLDSIRLPLHRAFILLFTAEERVELDMHDFVEDILAHLGSEAPLAALEGPQASTEHSAVEQSTPRTSGAAGIRITLNQALAYIKEQQ